MALLHGELSTQAPTAKARRKGTASGGARLTGEEGGVAALRLLTSVARFHRYVVVLARFVFR